MQCQFVDGAKRCRRRGDGSPPLCGQHRDALMAFQGMRPGLGSQLGALFETVISGKRPPLSEVDQVIAGVASKITGRLVSSSEVKNARSKLARGELPDFSSALPQDGEPTISWSNLSEAAKARYRAAKERVEQKTHAQQRAEWEKKEKLRLVTEARATLGFGPKEPVTAEMVKAKHRELAKKFHPDRQGGSTEQMQRVNTAVDVLLGTL